VLSDEVRDGMDDGVSDVLKDEVRDGMDDGV